MADFKSFPITHNTWCISTDFVAPNDSLLDFDGTSHQREFHDPTKVENLVLPLGLYEVQSYYDHSEWLQKTITLCQQHFVNLKNIYIFRETAFFSKDKLHTTCELRVIDIPYYLLRSTATPLNFKAWSPKNNKAIFIIGDTRNRPHRFQTLYEFYANNSLDLLEHSLNPLYDKNADFSWLIDWLNSTYGLTLNKDTFDKLYRRLQRIIPGDDFRNLITKTTTATLLVFPPYWNDAPLILMTESNFSHPVFPELRFNEAFPFTEKIWKPILSGRPFVTSSDQDIIYSNLEDMGFKTFLEYTDHPTKVETKMTAMTNGMHFYANLTYNRVRSFLQNKEKFQDAIRRDIEHNFSQWKIITDREWDKLYVSCPPLKELTRDEIGSVFGLCPNVMIYADNLRNKKVD